MTTTPAPIYQIIAIASGAFPGVVPFLTGRARWVALAAKAITGDWEIKTERQYLSQLTYLVKQVYAGELGGDFVDQLAAILSRQIELAHLEAWRDNGGDKNDFPDYLQKSADDMILREFDYVDQFYKDIVDARLDSAPIDALLARAELWAGRYNDAYNTAQLLIAEETSTEEKPVMLKWQLGQTEEHCEICDTLHGTIAPAAAWREAGIFPQSGEDGTLPNPALVPHRDGQDGCGGWRCDCRLTQTDEPATVMTAAELRDMIGWE